MARSLSNMMLKGLAGFPATNPLRTAVKNICKVTLGKLNKPRGIHTRILRHLKELMYGTDNLVGDAGTKFFIWELLRLSSANFEVGYAQNILQVKYAFNRILRSGRWIFAKVAKGSFFKCDIKWSTTVTHDPDTHEDFQPTNKLTGSGSSIQDIVEEDVQKHPIMIYMKGVPDAPRCGFSALAVKVLKEYGIPIRARNILEDQELKNGVKSVSNWPTFPQIFIKGEFIGGSDIVLNMHQRSWGIAHWLVSVQYMTILLIKREKKSILVNCEAAQLVAHTLTALRSKISELRI